MILTHGPNTTTPLNVHWPGAVKPGQVIDELADATDMLPTFADLTGAPLPEGVPLDGQSIVSLLKGTFFDLKNDPYEKKNLTGGTAPDVVAARKKLQTVLSSFGPNKEMTGFPRRHSALGKVPDLPAGSGKWKPFTVKAKDKNRNRRGRKGKKAGKAGQAEQ